MWKYEDKLDNLVSPIHQAFLECDLLRFLQLRSNGGKFAGSNCFACAFLLFLYLNATEKITDKSFVQLKCCTNKD